MNGARNVHVHVLCVLACVINFCIYDREHICTTGGNLLGIISLFFMTFTHPMDVPCQLWKLPLINFSSLILHVPVVYACIPIPELAVPKLNLYQPCSPSAEG